MLDFNFQLLEIRLCGPRSIAGCVPPNQFHPELPTKYVAPSSPLATLPCPKFGGSSAFIMDDVERYMRVHNVLISTRHHHSQVRESLRRIATLLSLVLDISLSGQSQIRSSNGIPIGLRVLQLLISFCATGTASELYWYRHHIFIQ